MKFRTTEDKLYLNEFRHPKSPRRNKISTTDTYSLGFSIRKSVRYHSAQRKWYDGLHLFSMFIALVSSGSAWAAIVGGKSTVGEVLTLFVAAIAIMDIVFQWSDKARTHDALCRRFHDLERKFNHEIGLLPDGKDDLSNEKLTKLKNEKLEIEEDEPTGIDALNVVCHNIQVQADGLPDEHLHHVGWLQRLFCNVFTFPPNDFPKKSI